MRCTGSHCGLLVVLVAAISLASSRGAIAQSVLEACPTAPQDWPCMVKDEPACNCLHAKRFARALPILETAKQERRRKIDKLSSEIDVNEKTGGDPNERGLLDAQRMNLQTELNVVESALENAKKQCVQLVVKPNIADSVSADLVVHVDGELVAKYGEVGRYYDKGWHTILLNRSGYYQSQKVVDVQQGLQVVVFEEAMKPIPKIAEPTFTSLERVGLAVAAGGAASLIVSLAMAWHAHDKYYKIPECGGQYCNSQGLDERAHAQAMGDVATVFGVVGGAALGVGGLLYFLPGSPKVTGLQGGTRVVGNVHGRGAAIGVASEF